MFDNDLDFILVLTRLTKMQNIQAIKKVTRLDLRRRNAGTFWSKSQNSHNLYNHCRIKQHVQGLILSYTLG